MFDFIIAPFFVKSALTRCMKKSVSFFIVLYAIWVCLFSIVIVLIMNGGISKDIFTSSTDARYLYTLSRPIIYGIVMDIFVAAFAVLIKRYFQISVAGSGIVKVYVIGRLILPVIRIATSFFATPIIPIIGFVYFAIFFCWGISTISVTEFKKCIGYVLVCIMALLILFSALPLMV